MSATDRAYWALIHANYTRAELIAAACWADELEDCERQADLLRRREAR